MKPSCIMLALVPLVFASHANAQGTPEQRIACGPEAMRLCASALPDIDKITQCMKEKRDSLNEACRMAMDAAAEQQPRTAEAPPVTQPEPAPDVTAKAEPDSTAIPVTAEKAEPVSAPKTTAAEPASPQQTASATSKAPADTQAGNSASRNKQTRRQVASRRIATRQRSDTAEAMYWMRRVTGYSGSLDVSGLERRVNGGLASLLR